MVRTFGFEDKKDEFIDKIDMVKNYFVDFFGKQYEDQINKRLRDNVTYVKIKKYSQNELFVRYIQNIKKDFCRRNLISKDNFVFAENLMGMVADKDFDQKITTSPLFLRNFATSLLFVLDRPGPNTEETIKNFEKDILKDTQYYKDTILKLLSDYKSTAEPISDAINNSYDSIGPEGYSYAEDIIALAAFKSNGFPIDDKYRSISWLFLMSENPISKEQEDEFCSLLCDITGEKKTYKQFMHDRKLRHRLDDVKKLVIKNLNTYRQIQQQSRDEMFSKDYGDLEEFINNNFPNNIASSYLSSIKNFYFNESGSTAAYVNLGLNLQGDMTNLCILPDGFKNIVAVHEMIHLISSQLKSVGASYVTCGVENDVNSTNLNEVLTDYFAAQINERMTKDGNLIGENAPFTSKYSTAFPVFKEFIERNKDFIKEKFIECDIDSVKSSFGYSNFNNLCNSTNDIILFSWDQRQMLKKYALICEESKKEATPHKVALAKSDFEKTVFDDATRQSEEYKQISAICENIEQLFDDIEISLSAKANTLE